MNRKTAKVSVRDGSLVVRGYRRQGRSPRKVLAFLRERNADALTAQREEFRNARRQQRADRKSQS